MLSFPDRSGGLHERAKPLVRRGDAGARTRRSAQSPRSPPMTRSEVFLHRARRRTWANHWLSKDAVLVESIPAGRETSAGAPTRRAERSMRCNPWLSRRRFPVDIAARRRDGNTAIFRTCACRWTCLAAEPSRGFNFIQSARRSMGGMVVTQSLIGHAGWSAQHRAARWRWRDAQYRVV